MVRSERDGVTSSILGSVLLEAGADPAPILIVAVVHLATEWRRRIDEKAIARQLGLTRQAVHTTVRLLINRGIVQLAQDPGDGRIKTVELTELGTAMRMDAQRIARTIADRLGERIGQSNLDALERAHACDWGPPEVCEIANGGPSARMLALLRQPKQA